MGYLVIGRLGPDCFRLLDFVCIRRLDKTRVPVGLLLGAVEGNIVIVGQT